MHRADFLSQKGQAPEQFVADVVAKKDNDTTHPDVGSLDPNVRALATLALSGRRKHLLAAYVARERVRGQLRNVELAHHREILGAAMEVGLACDLVDLPRLDAREVATSSEQGLLESPLERAAG
jgi:hypothetical protein